MQISQIVTLCSGATAFILNILLLPIILLRSSARIGCYKYFLFAYTMNASIFALSQVSTLPVRKGWKCAKNRFRHGTSHRMDSYSSRQLIYYQDPFNKSKLCRLYLASRWTISSSPGASSTAWLFLQSEDRKIKWIFKGIRGLSITLD